VTIATRLLSLIRDPANPALVVGSKEESRRRRLEWQRERWAQGIRARWPEIPAERIVVARYWIEDTETGNLYRELGGDPGYAETVVAYFEREGWPVMLEPADPPSLAEIERRKAAREERRQRRAEAAQARRDELRRSR
jgi:hypothetical protein